MRCFVGIDLGSTTTKAVMLDEQGLVLGRGITNSRSDYDVACAVARREALDDARLGLARRALTEAGLDAETRRRLLGRLEARFRLVQHQAQLAALEAQMVTDLPVVEALFPGASLGRAVAVISQRLREEAPGRFAEARPQSFFRDLAASRWGAVAEGAAGPGAPFEALLAVFDKAILKVECREVDIPLGRVLSEAADEVDAALGSAGGVAATTARAALEAALGAPLEVVGQVGTGYGRARLPFEKQFIRSEILCHGLGAHILYPGTRTVLDIGGQDTKAIQVDERGIVTGFQMNDRCAAGCGRYLGYIADEMNLGVHELGPLAMKAERPIRISSTCTVFAGAELRERMQLGQRREDILAGLHRAIMLRAMSLLARSGGVRSELTFTGGVANNAAAVYALARLVRDGYGEVTTNISPDSIYTGALGAAHFALRTTAEAPQEVAA